MAIFSSTLLDIAVDNIPKTSWFKKFTMRDLKRALKNSNNSSPGPDQIHFMIFYATFLLRLSIYYWTSSMKHEKVTYFRNRPIAVTSCICKTVERMVNERLVWYLENNGLLAKQQCGYRLNKSTVDHLVRLETFIRDAFIHNQHLVTVFFDLQKA